MTQFPTLIATSILSSLLASSAMARPDQTGTGGGSLSTEKAPNTTAVGQTKPPSRDASPTSVKPIDRVTPRQAADDAITNRVCIGCGRDPMTTGSLPVTEAPASPPEKRDVQLEELRASATPKQQSDLDTVALASAHRERAASVEEKTSGLWQSWLVSVCDGCGDQKPARSMKREDFPYRTAPVTTGPVDQKAAAEKAQHAEAKRGEAHHHGSLVADLSPENISSIRRMPQQ